MWERLLKSFKPASNYFAEEIVVRLLISLVLAVIISVVYKIVTHREKSHYSMTPSLILICITIAAAIMLIGDNLARSFGLVGAVSIIRFRSAVKSPLDMAFIFLTIVVGMACGLGLYTIAFIFFGIMVVVVLVTWKTGFITNVPLFIITFTYSESDISQEKIENILKSIAAGTRFISIRIKKSNRILKFGARIPLKKIGGIKFEFKTLLDKGKMGIHIESG